MSRSPAPSARRPGHRQRLRARRGRRHDPPGV